MNNITVNIVEPGSGPTPAPVVPNTGLFTHGIGGPEATIITVSIVAIIAIVALVLYYKKKHSKDNTANKVDKAEKATKLAETINTIKAKKKVSIPLAALALVVSLGTLTALLVNAGKSNTNAAEATDLTVTANDADLTIEVADTPVFAVLPVELTVEEATQAGYTLTAYTDNTDLVSTTDESKVIPMVAADEGELIALAEDTYGLSLTKPASQDDEVFTALSTDADAPTFITDKDYEATEANNKTTIYYSFYITPDTPKGTYEGSVINYEAKENTATVVYDGNGLNFNGAETNTVEYITNVAMGTAAYSHTPNVNDEGVQDGIYPISLNETFVYRFDNATQVHFNVVKTEADGTCGSNTDQYFSFWAGSHPGYTAVGNWSDGIKVLDSDGKYPFSTYSYQTPIDVDIEDSSMTFAYTTSDHRGGYCGNSGYGYYAIITATDADGNSVELLGNELYKGNYLIPTSEEATRFLGWSTDKDATTPMYSNEEALALGLELNPKDNITLYAVWQPIFSISYNGNGADSTTNMDNIEQYTTNLTSTNKQVDLLASNFKKEGYGFAGWSTDQDASSKINSTGDDKPTIYGPNQMITIDENLIAEAGENRKIVLNAVWVDPATDSAGNTLTFQTENLLTTELSDGTTLASKPNGYVTALKDERDNEVYTVAKLADGNYWMIENLRLDNEPELSNTNTNNPSLPLTNNYAEQTTSNKLSPTSNDWCKNSSNPACTDQSKLNTNNTALTAASPTFSQDFTSNVHTNFDTSLYSYSNYYNWYSATAGNGVQETTSTVAGDICPAGWMLPIGNRTSANGSFSHLDASMGGTGSSQGTTEASNKWRSFPNNFVYSGYWGGSSTDNRGYSGRYWSSTAYDTSGAYNLNFYSGGVYPSTSGGSKDYGSSVRCVAPVGTTITFDGNGNTGGEMSKQRIAQNTTAPLDSNKFTKGDDTFVSWNTERDGSGIDYTDGQNYTAGNESANITLYAQWEEATYMQDVATWGSTLNIGDEITVLDSRDNKKYTVARLADNNIWMTQNLDLDLNSQTALTPENTNISANWTPANSTISFTGTSVSGWSDSKTVPYSADPGALYIYSSGTTDNDEQYTSLEACQAAHSDCNTHNHTGNYYNWSAAVAANDTSSYTTQYDNITTSICPAGWRLPKSGNADDPIEGNEQITMINSYDDILGEYYSPYGHPGHYNYQEGGFNKIRTVPLFLARSGAVSNGSLGYTGSTGYYWSSTVGDSSGAYQLLFTSEYVIHTTTGRRVCGYSVRCIAE